MSYRSSSKAPAFFVSMPAHGGTLACLRRKNWQTRIRAFACVLGPWLINALGSGIVGARLWRTRERFPSNSPRAEAAAEGGVQSGSATPDNRSHSAISRSCSAVDAVCGSGVALTQMMEILAGDPGCGIVADGEPGLSAAGLVGVVGRAGAAHAGRDPAGVDRVRQHVRPAPRDGEGDQHVEKLALGIGCGAFQARSRQVRSSRSRVRRGACRS